MKFYFITSFQTPVPLNQGNIKPDTKIKIAILGVEMNVTFAQYS